MARTESTAIEDGLLKLFPSDWLREAARAVGFVRRRRKVDAVAFIWTLILGFGTGRERTIAGLRRTYELQAGTYELQAGETFVPSAFYSRFSPELLRLEQEMVSHALAQLRERSSGRFESALDEFEELLAADATVISLADSLEKAFPATRTNHTKAAVNYTPS